MFILVKRTGDDTHVYKEQFACLTSEMMIDSLFQALDDNCVVTIWKDD